MKTCRHTTATRSTRDKLAIWRENIRIILDICVEAMGPVFGGGGLVFLIAMKALGELSWAGFGAGTSMVFFTAFALTLIPDVKRDCTNIVRYHILKQGQGTPFKMEMDRRASATLAMLVVKILAFGTLPFLGFSIAAITLRLFIL